MNSFLVDLDTLKQLIGLGIWAGFFAGILATAAVLVVTDGLAGAAAKVTNRRAEAERAS